MTPQDNVRVNPPPPQRSRFPHTLRFSRASGLPVRRSLCIGLDTSRAGSGASVRRMADAVPFRARTEFPLLFGSTARGESLRVVFEHDKQEVAKHVLDEARKVAEKQAMASMKQLAEMRFDLDGIRVDDGLPTHIKVLDACGVDHPNIDSEGFICPEALRSRCPPMSMLDTTLLSLSDLVVRPCFNVRPLNNAAAARWYDDRHGPTGST